MTKQCSLHPLQGYYKWHARIYDVTRWSFLFGRDRLVRLASEILGNKRTRERLRIVEVGCGTGRNLTGLARTFPAANLTGIDLCEPMLRRAELAVAAIAPRTRLVCAAYGPQSFEAASADLIVFSYALSMFNPGCDTALDVARRHLAPGGLVAVADFRWSRAAWFRSWMGVNHVRMDDHLLPALTTRFDTVYDETKAAYGGLWDYFCYLGQVR